jgi:hypothetical protein
MSDPFKTHFVTGLYGKGMNLQPALVELVVSDMAATLAFYRRIGLDIPAGADGEPHIGIDIEAQRDRADSGSLEMDLSELAFDLAASASDRGTGVAVFVDEMQELSPRELAAICTAAHEAGQRSIPFYVIGAGPPSLPGLPAEARYYAEGLFDYRPIGPLAGPDAEIAVCDQLNSKRSLGRPRLSKQSLKHPGGYPYFVQEFAKANWDYARGPAVSAVDVTLEIQKGTRQA